MAYERRTYQQEAIAECLAAMTERGRESLLLESPVGSGKTYMALETIHRLQDHLGRRLRINWVAPRHRLLQQMMEANRDLYQDSIRPVSLFDRSPPEADFVVLDEAHHEATQSCVLLYEKMHQKWTMGLSATPMRTDRMKLSFQESVRTCSISRLIREGFLSPFNSFLIQRYTVDNVAEHYLADPGRWGKSLVFFSTIAECLDFRELLRKGGVVCEVVTGESDKDRQMELFEKGRVPVIANVAMLTEGFDQPDVKSVFARDSSRLPTIQMCGRGLRRAPGKVACNIVQSMDSPYLFERVAAAKNAFRWRSGRWLALKDGTEEIESTLKETLRRIEARQGRDKKKRRAEYRRVEQESPGRFTRQLERIAQAERRERMYYHQFEDVYQGLRHFYQTINMSCWGGQLPDCAIHLSKKYNQSPSIAASLQASFLRDGNKVVPAMVFHVANCLNLTARRIGIAVMKEMARLNLMTMGKGPNSEELIRGELMKLGYNAEKNTYLRDSPFQSVLNAADDILSPRIVHRFRAIMWDEFSGTVKGDAKYYLSINK